MPSFTDVVSGANAQAADVQQIVDALKGTVGKGIPLSPTGVNDAVNFALAVKNNEGGASKAFIVYKSDGTVLFQVDKNGVIASRDGVAAAGQLLTAVSPHVTGLVVDSGGLTVTAGGLTVTAGNTTLGGLLIVPNGGIAAGAGAVRVSNNQGVNWRNAANTSDDGIIFDGTDSFLIRPNLTTVATFNSTGATLTGNLTLGTNPAGAGIVRVPNNQTANWRNSGNTNDHSIGWDNTDLFTIKPNLTANVFSMDASGNVAIGSGVSSSYRLRSVGASSTSADWSLRSENSSAVLVLGARDDGQAVLGVGSLATAGTTGFPFMPAMAGAPTGVPAAVSGYVAFVYDTTNNKIMVYNGAWRGVVVA